MKNKKEKIIPAIPPDDYQGSQADWMIALQERGLWNGDGWHGDIKISETIWLEILEECEYEKDN